MLLVAKSVSAVNTIMSIETTRSNPFNVSACSSWQNMSIDTTRSGFINVSRQHVLLVTKNVNSYDKG